MPRTVRPRDTVKTHCLRLQPDEVTTRAGVPVTTVVRTIFDLSVYGRRAVERAMHEAEHRRHADALSLADLLERYPNRKGAGIIRAVLADRRAAIAGTDSAIEELFVEFLLDRGLPTGRTNAWIRLSDRWIRGDHVYDDEAVIVELDGGAHDTGFGRRSDDRRAGRRLAGHARIEVRAAQRARRGRSRPAQTAPQRRLHLRRVNLVGHKAGDAASVRPVPQSGRSGIPELPFSVFVPSAWCSSM